MKIGMLGVRSACAGAMALGLVVCGGGAGTAADAGLPQASALSATAALGEKIFNDTTLSASGQQSCASCRSPADAHAPANSLAVQPGGSQLELSGRRNTPSIHYASFTPAFSLAVDGTPSGGWFVDGRADTLQAQAAQPFTNPSALFHNGRFATLKEALTFYVQRDTQPEKFYPLAADGSVRQFDDLPPPYRANVNTREAPYNRRPGDAPALSDAEIDAEIDAVIDDVIAFLATLTDGYWR